MKHTRMSAFIHTVNEGTKKKEERNRENKRKEKKERKKQRPIRRQNERAWSAVLFLL